MANEIDLVVGEVAFQKITELIGRLKDVDTEFGKIATKFSNLGKTSNPQSTAELAKLTAENQKLNKALNDLKASYTTIDTELAKNTKLITDNTLATKAQTAADTLALKATEDQNSAYVKAAGAYANLDAQHKLAVKTAQDLAVATGRSTKEYELAKNKANELGKQLRVIDTDIGKHSRNVGNYSSSWNGLGNSINQLTREAPAFANSVQTGFMALSNNIPILTDELGVLIQKNKDLQKDGKPTESILKTLANGFFSWQTVISLGVTLLTVYGSKLIDIARGLGDVKDRQEDFKRSQAETDNAIINTTRTIEHQAEIRKQNLMQAGASEEKIRQSELKKEKDIQKNLVSARDAAKEKYENAKKYVELDSKAVTDNNVKDMTNNIIRKKRELAELRKLGYTATAEELKDFETNAINREGAVKKQGLRISELVESNQTARFKEAKKAQEKLDKLEDKPEKKVLKFDEVKSVHDLAEAKIEGQKIDLQSADLDKMTTEQKIENRTKLTEFELLKIFEVASEERAIADKKQIDDKIENNRAYKNQTISLKQYNKNIEDINKTHKTSLEKISVDGINKEKILLTAQEKYIEDLKDSDLKSTEQLAIAKLNTEIIAEKLIIDNKVKGHNYTKAQQEEAFKEYVKLSLAKIDLEEKMRIAEEPNPIKQEIIKQNFADLRKGIENILSPVEEVKKAFEDLSTSGEVYNKSLSASLDKLGMSSLKTFLDFDVNGESTFQKMWENADTTQQKTTVAFQAIGDAAQQAFGMMQESSDAYYQGEYAKLDAQKEVALKNAGDSTAAKEKIEADYAKKKKELELKQFKDKQKMAVANIAIDTAQAIMQIWAHAKDPSGISQTAMSIIIGALGAVQMGMVIAQKPPAYADGTDNHSGGLMLVNDGAGSNYQEKVILPSGKVIRPQGRNVLMDAPKGTKVLNHEQQLFEMLQSNNISMSSPQYQGMTPDEMDEILGKHFGNIKTQNTIFDKNGFQSYVRNGNSITRSNSNRSQAIGISV